MGRSQGTALSGQIRRILHHLLKLEFSPAEAPRECWRRSVREARVAADYILKHNPMLGRGLADIVDDQSHRAATLAIIDLAGKGELDDETAAAIHARVFDLETEILSNTADCRTSRLPDGGTQLTVWLGPEAAAALDRLMELRGPGVTISDVVNELLIEAAERLTEGSTTSARKPDIFNLH